MKQWRQRIVLCIVELGHELSRDACDLAGIMFVYVLLNVVRLLAFLRPLRLGYGRWDPDMVV